MYAPRVFVSMTMALLAFAIASYFINGSILTTFVQTLICAVLLQVGYFIGVLYLVRRERMSRQEKATDSAAVRRKGDASRHDDLPAKAAAKLEIGDH
ncbi:exopolysaccharide production repressor protein [Rhizobium sp. LCM 4573]|uniref:exopolysaccharide production repressor protein n=1 Tax=Rhizobium sp. LCM 4573 TaxID=1848291 RepID=UPI0008DA3A38|nr:exopolysaccharide production repressor protein [Rhizobium sp. LCM 4573]OHV85130.1 hypothetical protein LCM4573_04755 [Rhizobium sp. LCM 4573]